ncbi:MAG: prolipoprotein diacylglyceryl transferase [Acidimicrobiia bacterium]|nr:prolipoprotein diacylglyceryl transferase [Acidimicrobiia bacterium]
MEFTLLWATLIAALGVWIAVKLLSRSEAVPYKDIDQFDVILGAAIVGLGVGRLAAMITTGTNPLTHPGLIPLVRGGVHTGWATIAALGWLAWFGRRRGPGWVLYDGLAAPALAGLAAWEAGCLVRSACLGTSTSLPWGIAGSGGVLRHPAGIYAAIGLLVATIVIGRLLIRRPPEGAVAAAALAAAAGVRLLVEPMRVSLGAGQTWWYAAGLVIGIGLLGWRAVTGAKPSVPGPQLPAQVESGRLTGGEHDAENHGEDLRQA